MFLVSVKQKNSEKTKKQTKTDSKNKLKTYLRNLRGKHEGKHYFLLKIRKYDNKMGSHIILQVVWLTFLDLLDALEKNDRILVLNLLFVTNIDFKEPLDEQGFFLHKAG